MEGDVRRIEIDPETDSLAHLLPLADVLEHRVDALAAERLDPVVLDRLAAADAELLFDLDLDRETVGVPAGAPGYVVTAHRPVAQEHILHDSGEHVTGVGHAIRRWWALVEDEGLFRLAAFQGLLENASVFPERELGRVELGERNLRGDGVEHGPAAYHAKPRFPPGPLV